MSNFLVTPWPTSAIGPWLTACIDRDSRRWVLWLPVAYGLGAALYLTAPTEPTAPALAGASLTLVAAGLVSRLRWGDRQGVRAASILAIAVAIGGLAAKGHVARLDRPMLERDFGPVRLEATVSDVEPSGRRQRLLLTDITPSRPLPDGLDRPGTIVRVSVGVRDPAFVPGDRIRLLAQLLPSSEPVIPGSFDFRRHHFFAGLAAIGYGYGRPEIIGQGAGAGFWQVVRHRLGARIMAGLPDTSGAIAVALLTGNRSGIEEDVQTAMRDAGLAHLLAISGLHIGLVAGAIFFGVRAVLAAVPFLALRAPIKNIAALLALAAAILYMLAVGAPVPTQRAVVMAAIALLAILVNRRAFTMRMVAIAAGTVLLVAPQALLSASFQLSFAAVVCLIAGLEHWQRIAAPLAGFGPETVARGFRYLLGVCATSLIATLATALPVIYHFQTVPSYGLAANLIAVPVTSFVIMPAGLLGVLFMPVGLEAVPLAVMGWGIDGVVATAETTSSWPYAVLHLPPMPPWGLAATALGGLWLCLNTASWRLFGLFGPAAGLLSVALADPPHLAVTEDGRLAAIRVGATLHVTDLRGDRFVQSIWHRHLGTDDTVAWPDTGRVDMGDLGTLGCDAAACILSARSGLTLAYLRRPEAIGEDCRLVDVAIAPFPLPRGCGRLHTIGRFEGWRAGAHTIRLDPDGVRIDSAVAAEADRPWSPRRGRFPRDQ